MARGEPRGVIPIHEARREELATSSIGMIIFLGAWTMMFAALFFVVFMLRARGGQLWSEPHPQLPVLLPAVNTLIIAASSFTMHLATAAARATAPRPFARWLYATVALGVIFIAAQTFAWT